jgi:hypothetical protein
MKKAFVMAMAATLVAGAAFAQTSLNATRYAIQPNATFAAGSPTTTNNDDSCDITVSPSASLLLPYFEVDYRSGSTDAVNTIFTITNTSNVPQIAHVTVWTDWSYPVLDFNIFLTGYDVQGVNLYDIINRGTIPGTSITTTRGSRSLANTSNPNINNATAASTCANLPGPIGTALTAAIQAALTTGDGSFYGCDTIGGTHDNAVGYITVDVANNCSQTLPVDPAYFTSEILFDNTLIGDYQRINPNTTVGNFAGGSPMVHIKAIPEGGPAGSFATNLPYTFYSRYSQSVADRRQPLPALFAARYINQGTAGFDTDYLVWREGYTSGATTQGCDLSAVPSIEDNGSLPIAEVVRFDEAENPTTLNPGCRVSPCQTTIGTLPETSRTGVDNSNGAFPLNNGTAVGGWMYLNLHNDPTLSGIGEYPALNGASAPLYQGFRPSQNWVVVEMTAEGRYGVDFDAAYLGNGCTGIRATGATINPAGGVCASTTAPCTTINNTP